jgi:amino acid adenylation domain-containing protein
VNDLAQAVTQLDAKKRELLALLLKQEGISSARMPILPRPRDGRPVQLSFTQERIWFLDQLAPGNPFYNNNFAFQLTGRLEVAVLARVLAEIARRHEILRTTFAEVDGRPCVAVRSKPDLPLAGVDLSALPADRRAAELRLLGAREVRRPFALSRGPLLRPLVLRMSPGEHVLLLTVHHIVFDAWSAGLLFREMGSLYETFRDGRPAPLPEPAIQYADFALWQREWLQGKVLEAQVAYWKERLRGAPPVLELPADHPRPATLTYRGTWRPFALDPELTLSVRALGRQEGTTLFAVLLAAFQALLGRFTGQEDVVVGTPVAGRSRREVENLIGCFINNLVLRGDLAGNPGFRDLLRRAQSAALGAFENQDLPFEKLVEEIRPQRDMSHTPLFQAMLSLQTAPMRPLELPGLTVAPLKIDSGSAKVDLMLHLAESAGGLRGWLEYSTDLFEAATVDRFGRCFKTLLAGAVARPEQRLLDLPLLAEEERHQTLIEWSDTAATFSGGLRVDELFARRAARTPKAVALAWEGGRLTCGALEELARGLARRLALLGVGLETPVGICVERSPAMVAALLAVWKAGGAYVPMDPSYPEERLAFMLDDADVRVLVADAAAPAALLPRVTHVLRLDEPLAEAAATEANIASAPPESLAYVIYTSGSTGRPKGVEIAHGALASFLFSMARRPGLAEGEALLAVTSLSFDIAGLELFLPLVTGGRVELVSRAVAADGEQLLARLRSSQAAVMQATPATWRLLIEAGWQGEAPLRVLCGGEALPDRLAAELTARSASVWNLYGPTETTIWSAVARVWPDRAIEIGPPIANTALYVLDRQGGPAAIGVPGELVIGGVGLARGYRGQPARTAERFLPDPFSGVPGSRLYRTGDLARFRPHGRLELLGRIDHQVKVRGVRMELGEIETVLERHPAVRQAVVALRHDLPGGPALVAYLVAAEGLPAPAAAELRALLRRALPESMVPAFFQALPALPLTPNGKVDRRALPPPDLSPQRPCEPSGAAAGGHDPMTEIVTAAWAQVLGRTEVGPHDNFFDLGGHSLSATQVASRLRGALGIDLPVRALFERPTAAGLAAHVEELLRDGAPPPPPLLALPRTGVLPLTFAQQRFWLLDRMAAGSAAFNIAQSARLAGRLDVPALQAVLTEIVRRHEALRIRFETVGGEPAQAILPAGPWPLPVVDLSGLPEPAGEAERLGAEESRQPFDLVRGPLLRTRLVRLAREEHLLLFTFHHAAADEWSIGVFLRELGLLYEAFSERRASPLPELPLQMADFAVWQRTVLAGERLAGLLAYWRRKLAGMPAETRLPADRPRRPGRTAPGVERPFLFAADLAPALDALGLREGATLFMTMLAGFAALLYRYTGQSDLIVGSPVANRNWAETEGLIGVFFNSLPLRVDLAGDPSFRELLRRVRETALEAFAHQDLPIEKLVEELSPQRYGSRAPLFQVQLLLQNAPMPLRRLPGLRLEVRGLDNDAVKFDLSLVVGRRPEGLGGAWLFNSELFDPATIDGLLASLESLLRSAAAEPETRLSQLPLADGCGLPGDDPFADEED